MSLNMIAILGAGAVVFILGGLLIYRRLPKRLKGPYFVARWKELQAYCRDKSTWVQALLEADKLLDRALKRRRFKGKSMGERMVSAQRSFSENDAVWYAHNLCKKALADKELKLRESEVKRALMGFRRALRDIGALPEEQ